MNEDKKNLRRDRVDNIWDLLLLNIVFVLSCLPVVSYGAARTALYAAVSGMPLKRIHGSTIGTYWSCLKSNWRQPTVLWIAALASIAVLAADFIIAGHMSTVLRYCSYGLIGAVCFLVQAVISLAFPFASIGRFRFKELAEEALSLLASYPAKTVLVCALHILPICMAAFDARLFAKLFLLWSCLYFSAVEFVIWKLFGKAIYMESAE